MAAFRLDRGRRLDLAATDPISGALATGRGAHDRLRARPLHDRRRAIFARSLRRGSGAACNESSSSMSTQLLLTQAAGSGGGAAGFLMLVPYLLIFAVFWFFLIRSEEHTSELQSLMRISYAVFCLQKKNNNNISIT